MLSFSGTNDYYLSKRLKVTIINQLNIYCEWHNKWTTPTSDVMLKNTQGIWHNIPAFQYSTQYMHTQFHVRDVQL